MRTITSKQFWVAATGWAVVAFIMLPILLLAKEKPDAPGPMKVGRLEAEEIIVHKAGGPKLTIVANDKFVGLFCVGDGGKGKGNQFATIQFDPAQGGPCVAVGSGRAKAGGFELSLSCDKDGVAVLQTSTKDGKLKIYTAEELQKALTPIERLGPPKQQD